MSSAVALFRDRFGESPVVAASAPGRVNLLGEHTDYNGGPVLPIAIERRTTVAAGPADGWHFVSTIDPAIVEADIDAPMQKSWSSYLVGVVRELRIIGTAPPGARVAVSSTVPLGAGLSSSAALTVAAAAGLQALTPWQVEGRELADLAWRAEHDQVGVRCGRMDQTVAALAQTGHALLFETGSGRVTQLPMPHPILVVETGVSHRLTGGALNERRRECEEALTILRSHWKGLASLAALPPDALGSALPLLPGTLARRVRHVVTETARTRRAAGCLADGDMHGLGELLVAGHASLRRDYESTLPEADAIVESAVRHGALGARLTGAGWGGAVLVLTPAGTESRVARLVQADFAVRFGRKPPAWTTEASDGVRREPV